MSFKIEDLTVIATDISLQLHSSNIPNVVWGLLPVNIVKEDTNYPEIEFIIPDDRIPEAKNAMVTADLTPYVTPADPDYPNEPDVSNFVCLCRRKHCKKEHAISFMHVSPEGLTVVTLHRQSEILPWLPRISSDHPTPEHPHYTLAADPSIVISVNELTETGSLSPWAGLYPVIILTPGCYAEAALALYARDFLDPSGVKERWLEMLDAASNSQEGNWLIGLLPDFQLLHDAIRRNAGVIVIAAAVVALRTQIVQQAYNWNWQVEVNPVEGLLVSEHSMALVGGQMGLGGEMGMEGEMGFENHIGLDDHMGLGQGLGENIGFVGAIGMGEGMGLGDDMGLTGDLGNHVWEV